MVADFQQYKADKKESSSQPWHLKYRPIKLSDLIGQGTAKTVLGNMLRNDSVPNALLLIGPSGTGKTTAARIAAMALNCEAKGVEPCGVCESCQSIQKGINLDIIEVDAASHNGVDDIRDIIKVAAYASGNKYRIYIIDEAHQLTTQAQNAFLKTLEEPNSRTKFLLCTTEPNKLLNTIVSRCVPIRFKAVQMEAVIERLKEVSEAEGLTIDDESLKAIARITNGGMRSGIQLLFEMHCLSQETQKPITPKLVYDHTGELSGIQIGYLLKMIATNNSSKLVECGQKITATGIDPIKVINGLLGAWTDVLSSHLSDNIKFVAKTSILSLEQIKALKQQTTIEMLNSGLNKLDEAERRIKTSSSNDRWLLATLLLLCQTEGGK